MFKVLDVNNDKKLSESDLFQIMKWSSSNPQGALKDPEQPSMNQENDIFLEIFSSDFCKIVKSINLKRKVRGRDDINQAKMKALENKL